MLKDNWILRVIVSFLITNMALGGWASMNNVSLDTYIPIALVWCVINYFLFGFIFNKSINKYKKNKNKNNEKNN